MPGSLFLSWSNPACWMRMFVAWSVRRPAACTIKTRSALISCACALISIASSSAPYRSMSRLMASTSPCRWVAAGLGTSTPRASAKGRKLFMFRLSSGEHDDDRSFVNYDATAAEQRGGVTVLGCAPLVVVDHGIGALVPDLQAEPVGPAAAVQLPVDRGEEEAVDGRAAVDCPIALELRLRACDDEPLVARALEREVALLELKLRVAGRVGRALQVLRDEAEARLAPQRGVGRVGAGGTRDPAAAGGEAGARVVHDDVGGDAECARDARREIAVMHRDGDGVDTGSCVQVAPRDGASAVRLRNGAGGRAAVVPVDVGTVNVARVLVGEAGADSDRRTERREWTRERERAHHRGYVLLGHEERRE